MRYDHIYSYIRKARREDLARALGGPEALETLDIERGKLADTGVGWVSDEQMIRLLGTT